MKKFLLCGALALGGCGTIGNLIEGPSPYGGICNDFEAIGAGTGPCSPGVLMALDVPLSFALDTVLLPFTAIYRLCAPPPEPDRPATEERDSSNSNPGKSRRRRERRRPGLR